MKVMGDTRKRAGTLAALYWASNSPATEQKCGLVRFIFLQSMIKIIPPNARC